MVRAWNSAGQFTEEPSRARNGMVRAWNSAGQFTEIDDTRRRQKKKTGSAGENGQCGSSEGQVRARDIVWLGQYNCG